MSNLFERKRVHFYISERIEWQSADSLDFQYRKYLHCNRNLLLHKPSRTFHRESHTFDNKCRHGSTSWAFLNRWLKNLTVTWLVLVTWFQQRLSTKNCHQQLRWNNILPGLTHLYPWISDGWVRRIVCNNCCGHEDGSSILQQKPSCPQTCGQWPPAYQEFQFDSNSLKFEFFRMLRIKVIIWNSAWWKSIKDIILRHTTAIFTIWFFINLPFDTLN